MNPFLKNKNLTTAGNRFPLREGGNRTHGFQFNVLTLYPSELLVCLLGKSKVFREQGSRLRRLDSNQRPPGYEPSELPLLYAALLLTFLRTLTHLVADVKATLLLFIK